MTPFNVDKEKFVYQYYWVTELSNFDMLNVASFVYTARLVTSAGSFPHYEPPRKRLFLGLWEIQTKKCFGPMGPY